jgi:hypothetical protein
MLSSGGNGIVNRFRRLIRRISSAFTRRTETPSLFTVLNYAWIGQALYVATHLDVPDALTDGPASARELSIRLHVQEAYLQQVLRALCSFGVFEEDDAGRFRLTALSEDLVRSRDSWLRHYILLWGEQLHAAAGRTLDMVTTGRTAFALAFGRPLYEHYQTCPAAGARFEGFMNAVTKWQRDVVVASFDFRPYRHVVDIGGGRASMLVAAMQANLHLRGTILDQPHMAERVEQQLRGAGLSDRCTFVGGSLFADIPAWGDLYMIKHVLHDWPDHDVETILRNIATAMPDDGTLVIVEAVLDARSNTAQFTTMRDLEQMFWTGGKLRTRAEFFELLHMSGMELREVRTNAIVDTALVIAGKQRR